MKKLGFAAIVALAMLPSLVQAQPTPITACQTTITNPGSYVLTGNLQNPNNNASCITVQAYQVTIDMAGFSIRGLGARAGIYSVQPFLTVKNGTIRFFGTGVQANVQGVKLDGVRVYASHSTGAVLGDDAQVTDSQFITNGGDGLDVGANAVIERCTFDHNSIYGMFALGVGAMVRESTAANNTSHGIVVDAGATVVSCTAQSNGNTGFIDIAGVNGGTAFMYNSSFSNTIYGFATENSSVIGNVAKDNGSDGFNDSGRSTLQSNVSTANAGNGFFVSNGATLTSNTSTGNGTGGTGWGFNVICPSNVIGNTAFGNATGSETESGSPACQKVTNLFP